ncbi:MAG: TylF/MycF/NovP-related O-methyltransferase [Patescibacteria group bacterium]
MFLLFKKLIYRYYIQFNLDFFYKNTTFVKLVKQIRKEVNFLLSNQETYILYSLVQNTKKIKGDIAEVGCYEGGSTKIIAEVNMGFKKIYVFDTFEGLPKVNKLIDVSFSTKDYQADYKKVKNYLKKYKKIFIYKGKFPETGSVLINKKFSFVHLDVDIYKSTLDSLNFFYPKLNQRAIILSHDYYGGVKKAFAEFLKDKPEIVIQSSGTYCLIVKH